MIPPAARLAAPLLVTALLAASLAGPAHAAESGSVSVTWTSREDFEKNAAAREGVTSPDNIRTDDPPGDVVLGQTTTGGKLLGRSALVRTADGIGRRTGIAVNATGDAVVVWRETGRTGHDIMARSIGPDGVPRGEAVAVTDNPRVQNLPRVAADGRRGTFLAVWQDKRAGHRVFARLLDRNAAPAGEELAVSPGTSWQYSPDVAWNARTGEYLVVWREEREGRSRIWGRRVTGDGKPAGKTAALSAREGKLRHPRAAADSGGGTYLAVWSDDREDDADIYGRIISGEGKPAGDSFPVCSARGKQLFPEAVFNPGRGEFLVAWDDYRIADPEREALERRASHIRMRGLSYENGVDIWARILPAGDAPAADPFPLIDAPWNQLHASLALDPGAGQYLLVWQDSRDRFNNLDIRGLLVEADGRPAAGEILFGPAEHQQLAPAAAWNPRTGEFLAAWKSHRESGSSLNDLYVQRVGRGPGAEGSLQGLVVDTGSERPAWEGLYWNADLPEGTALAVRTRSGDSQEELRETDWSAAVLSSGSQVPSPPGRWLEIEVQLSTTITGATPALQNLTLRYSP